MAIYDLSLTENILIENKLDMALQELDIMFNTERCELIGETTFGSVFEKFLWEMNQTDEAIKNYIYDVMSESYIFNEMVDDIQVKMVDGEYRPIYLIQITLKDDSTGKTQSRSFQFK